MFHSNNGVISVTGILRILSVLRATELGVLSPDVVRDAASRQDFSGRTLIDVGKVVEEVKAICKV